ncbi:hypothetical protein [Methanomassiliicoccus luminyensis]|uniref:hypothetical protein n=1 Tax=Methanomassiliicoccus luminyensis TaxID=1080712 RepID=UPI00035CCC9D|nr:hypothetical protein [Methanomassiliicoccus luminyensis]
MTDSNIDAQQEPNPKESWWKRNAHPIWSKKLSKRSRNLSILTMIICAVLVVVMVSTLLGQGIFFRSATVYVNAQSSHITNTVTLTIEVNDIEIYNGPLGPLEKKTVEYAPFFTADSKEITITYRTSGGGLGPTDGTKTITIEQGETVNINLLV